MQEPNQPRLKGAPNFRDIGGYESGDGRRVKRGSVFRSGHLAQLTAEDMGVLQRLAIGTVIDLRNKYEMKSKPSRWPENLATERVYPDIQDRLRAVNLKMKAILELDQTPRGMHKMVDFLYREIPVACGPAFKCLVDRLLTGEAPVLFHCTNGRDRTGILAAVLLHLLGVPRDTIVADYLETNRRVDVEASIELNARILGAEFGFNIGDEMIRVMGQVRAQNVDNIFDSLANKYGSAEGYMEAFGVDAEQQKQVRQRLLEPV